MTETDENPRDRAVRECGEWLVQRLFPHPPVHQAFLDYYEGYWQYDIESVWWFFQFGQARRLVLRPEYREVQSPEVLRAGAVSAPDTEGRDDSQTPGPRSLYGGVFLYH